MNYAIRAAAVGGAILVVLDMMDNRSPHTTLIAGCILLGSSLIAAAVAKSSK